MLLSGSVKALAPDVLQPTSDVLRKALDLNLRLFFFLAGQAAEFFSVRLRSPVARYTVFAPNDDAFAALGGETFDFLANTPEGQDELVNILSYHVLSSPLFSVDLTDGLIATTLHGGQVQFRRDGSGSLFVNDARIEGTDFLATNGVVHVIDREFYLL